MRQLLQSLNTGEVELLDVPCPSPRRGHLLIQTDVTLISAGTERMLVEFGKASLLQKARQQPERVKDVWNKIRSQGLLPTLEAVQSKLNESIPLGYCNVGRVLEVGADVDGFEPGDRVVSNGSHSEVVSVPQNLCAKIPDNVTDEDAAFTVVSAIGLQGVRLAEPTLGECFVVTGLGLIGLLTTQLLRSNGCRVLGIDFDPERLKLAEAMGADTVHAGASVVDAANKFSRGRGVDGVLVTASCKSHEPMHQAAQMCRKRGRIVLVGVAGLNLQRSDFYEKELQFRVSCSYGPGRYDEQYEAQGVDYPIGFVRWTEQRNFEAVLDQFATGTLSAAQLRTHEFSFENAADAYRTITGEANTSEANTSEAQAKPALGVLLRYQPQTSALRSPTVQFTSDASPCPVDGTPGRPNRAQTDSEHADSSQSDSSHATPTGRVRMAMLGAGNFSKRMLMPNFRKSGAEIVSVASQAGLTAAMAARSQSVPQATTDWQSLVARQDVHAVAIATRHDSHAEMTVAALEAGKHVFVEKPLALNRDELQRIDDARTNSAGIVMVGFNRRFAPMIQTIRSAVRQETEPKSLVMTVNAGALPADHWTHDPIAGGGRILGEACHFVDLLRHLVGSPITRVQAAMLCETAIPTDKMSILLSFADGSQGAIHYLANGSRAFPKERLEVFCNEQILQLDNFRRLQSFGWKGVKGKRSWKRDLGHATATAEFVRAISTGGSAPIPWEELAEVADVCFDIMNAAQTGETVHRASPMNAPLRRSA